ncbi:MAG: hypothetical protein K2G78_03115, partial [Muribaculaceae bacterium]|nr:hypothetical protein [Muribaculaceae bacterium]
MKTIATLLALALTVGCGYAQNISKSEAKSLNTFLNLPAAKGGNNAEALKMTGNNIASCPGVKVENGHVVEIDWKGKDLAGTLNLSAFPDLKKIDVSNNKISAIVVSNNPDLVVLNDSHNNLSDVQIDGSPAIQELRHKRTRLNE